MRKSKLLPNLYRWQDSYLRPKAQKFMVKGDLYGYINNYCTPPRVEIYYVTNDTPYAIVLVTKAPQQGTTREQVEDQLEFLLLEQLALKF